MKVSDLVTPGGRMSGSSIEAVVLLCVNTTLHYFVRVVPTLQLHHVKSLSFYYTSQIESLQIGPHSLLVPGV